jgi:hypothetical protein
LEKPVQRSATGGSPPSQLITIADRSGSMRQTFYIAIGVLIALLHCQRPELLAHYRGDSVGKSA